MEHHVSWLTQLINHYFGGLALSFLHALHISPADTASPISEAVVMQFVVFLIGIGGALWLRSRLSVESPGAAQQIAEMLLTNPTGFGIRDLLEENAGHEGLQYVPVVGSVSAFILLANLLTVFPMFSAPTAEKSVPLGCPIVTFLYFNWHGSRHQALFASLRPFPGPLRCLLTRIFPATI